MQEAEEQDTCRICSAPAEPDQPLFHPCKCSGTIRYIHQDCLTTWLAHSKKKTCDVCKHSYSFTKVYAPDMPAKLPTILLLRRLAQQVLLAILFVIRGIIVGAIWLGVLPWVTVWTWRMYFSMGESTAWWISDRPKPPQPSTAPSETNPFYTVTSPSFPPAKNLLLWLTSHPVWLTLPADIFTGQIIASLIVLSFVAVFLLREWISQNARPGLFEDEVGMQIPPLGPGEPLPQQQQAQNQQLEVPPPLPPPHAPAAFARNAGPPPPFEDHPQPQFLPNPEPLPIQPPTQDFQTHSDDEDHWEDEDDFQRGSTSHVPHSEGEGEREEGFQPKRKKNGSSTSIPTLERERQRERFRQRRIPAVNRVMGLQRRRVMAAVAPNSVGQSLTTNEEEKSKDKAREGEAERVAAFDFTFTAQERISFALNGPSGVHLPQSASASTSSPPSTSPFPQVDLSQPSTSLPFSLEGYGSSSAGPSFLTLSGSSSAESSIPSPFHSPSPYSIPSSRSSISPPPSASTSASFECISFPPPPAQPQIPTFNFLPPTPHQFDFARPNPPPNLASYQAPEDIHEEESRPSTSASMLDPHPQYGSSVFGVPLTDSPLSVAMDIDSEDDIVINIENIEPKSRFSSFESDVHGYDHVGVEENDVTMREEEEEGEMLREEREKYFPLSGVDEDEDKDTDKTPTQERDELQQREGGGLMILSDSNSDSSEDDERELEDEPGRAGDGDEAHDDEDSDLDEDLDDDFEAFLEEDEAEDEGEDEDEEGERDEWVEEGEEPWVLRIEEGGAAAQGGVGPGVAQNGFGGGNLEWPVDQQPQNAFGNGFPAGGAGGNGVAPVGGVGGGAIDPEAAAAAAAAGLDPNDDIEGNVEDDMEGAMEAIGMRGPIYGVVQNAALMIFVLDTAIGLGVWIPFTIGKTTALLSLDPHRMLQVLHLPIKAMRIVTDPFVDTIAYLLIDLLLPRVVSLFKGVYRFFSFFSYNYVGRLLGTKVTDNIAESSSKFYDKLSQVSFWSSETIFSSNNTAPTPTSHSSDFFATLPDHLGFAEPYFSALGQEVRLLLTSIQSTWASLALGSGPRERAWAVLLGYLVVIVFVLMYLNLLVVGNTRSAGAALRNTIKQQLLVFKVAAFIFIELVMFPLGCGIVLDLSTVWLFPEANLQSRVAFFVQAPLTAMFYHWVAGTMFMYSFAVLLSGCRKVMRAGAMWFIKDPQDPNSHPIRDILDRPTFTQLRKICISGIMYSFVVVCVVGSVAGLLVIGRSSIMPFRWKNREPLSNVPVDLIFLHLVLPYTMRYFQPKGAIKDIATVVWKFLAKRLRLTSYFFGDRHPSEEYTPSSWGRWKQKLVDPDEVPEDEDVVVDGTFRRVPATDNLALPRDMRATAAVTEAGEPIDDGARELITLQDAEAAKAKHDAKDDYRIVYIPPYFRWRVMAFIALLWMFGALMLGTCVAVPIQLGRSFFRLWTPREVHDGYSFIVGFYLLWSCYLFAKAVDKLDKRRQRRRVGGGRGPRAQLYFLVLKRGFLWAVKTAYMVFFLGVVVPVLIATVIDLYLVLPLRFALDPGLKPRIRVVDSWAMGLVYAKIATHMERLPPNAVTRGWRHIKQHGWTRPDPIRATREVIAPLVGGLLGMILFPAALFLVFRHFFPSAISDDRFLLLHVYPTVFIMAGAFRTSLTFLDVMSSWSQTIRDTEFLVEMRLRNHDPEKEKKEENGHVDIPNRVMVEAAQRRAQELEARG